jgi:hypothetical protein
MPTVCKIALRSVRPPGKYSKKIRKKILVSYNFIGFVYIRYSLYNYGKVGTYYLIAYET